MLSTCLVDVKVMLIYFKNAWKIEKPKTCTFSAKNQYQKGNTLFTFEFAVLWILTFFVSLTF